MPDSRMRMLLAVMITLLRQCSASRRNSLNVSFAVIAAVTLIGAGISVTSARAAAIPYAPGSVIYSYGSDPLQTVTVYKPGQGNGEAVVLIHGDGFQSSAKDASTLAVRANTLTAAGDTVFVVNYRNDTNGVGIAAVASDVIAGTLWAVAHASQFGASSAHLTLIGGSSGGILTGIAAEQINKSWPGLVKTVITLSGTIDLPNAFAYWLTVPGPTGLQHIDNLSNVLGCTVSKHKHVTTYNCPTALEVQYSPDRQITSAECPNQWITINGNAEEQPVSQAVAMDTALAVAGCAHTLTIIPDAAHSFSYWTDVQAQLIAAIASS